MPPWELKAVEYIVGAVLLGLALVFATDDGPVCVTATRDVGFVPADAWKDFDDELECWEPVGRP